MAYKKNVNDVRESPAIEVIEELEKKGAHVAYTDPFVPSLELSHGLMKGVSPESEDTVLPLIAIAEGGRELSQEIGGRLEVFDEPLVAVDIAVTIVAKTVLEGEEVRAVGRLE